MLVLSDLHGAASVRALALKFIVENGKEIVAQNGWRERLKVKKCKKLVDPNNVTTYV